MSLEKKEATLTYANFQLKLFFFFFKSNFISYIHPHQTLYFSLFSQSKHNFPLCTWCLIVCQTIKIVDKWPWLTMNCSILSSPWILTMWYASPRTSLFSSPMLCVYSFFLFLFLYNIFYKFLFNSCVDNGK